MQTINEITMQQTPESLFKFEMPIDSMEPKQLLRYALHQARGWRSMAKSLSNTYNLYEGPNGEILSHPTAHQICDWIDEHLASFDEDMIRVATPELVLEAAARHYDDVDFTQEPIRSVLVKHITTYLYAKKYEATLLNKAELVQEPKPKKKASPKTKKAAVEVTEEPKPEEETKEEQPQEPKPEEETKEEQPQAPKPKKKASPKTKKTAVEVVEETKEEQPQEPKPEEETKEEQPQEPKPKKKASPKTKKAAVEVTEEPKPKKRAAPKTKKAAVEVTEEPKPEEETKEEHPQEPKPEEETKEEQPKKKASPKAKKAEAEVTEEEPKKKRSPSAYNVFISNELSRLRQEDPKLNHKVAMAMAVAAWKTNKAADESAEKKETTEEVEQSTQEEAAQPEVTLEKVLSA